MAIGAKGSGMKEFGGTLSILTGIVFFATALAFFLLPPEQQDFTARSELFTSILSNPTVLELTFFGSMIGALLAIAVVLAIVEHMGRVNKGLVCWSSLLAIIAYAVSATRNATDLIQIPDLASRYVSGDLLTRKAIEAVGLPSIDPGLILQSLLLGIWFLTVDSLALRTKALPRWLACVGLVFGIGSLLTLPFLLLNLQFVLGVAMALGLVVISPVWFIGTGIVLRRYRT